MRKVLIVLFCLTLAIGLTSAFMPSSRAVVQSTAQGQVSASPASPSGSQGNIELTERRTAFSKTYSLGEYSYQTVIGTSSMHYRDADGNWMDIDETLVPTEGSWVVEKGHWKLKVKADGTLEAKATSSKKFTTKPLYMGYLNTETGEISVINYFNTKSAGFAEENKYTWPSAYPATDIEVYYTSDLLKENIVLSQLGRELLPSPNAYGIDPSKAQLVYGYAADWNGCDMEDSSGNKVTGKGLFKLTGKDFTESLYIKDGGQYVAMLTEDVATMNDLFADTSHRVIKRFGDGLFTCGIMYSDLIAMPMGDIVIDPTIYFYPNSTGDPNPTSVDGFANRNGLALTWNDMRNGPGMSASAAYSYNANYIGSSHTPGRWETLNRFIFLFDTSAMPDDATINSAELKLYCLSKQDALGIAPSYVVVSSNPASSTQLVASDYNTLGDSVGLSYVVPWNDILPGAWTTFGLSTWAFPQINKTGVTKFGVRNWNYDMANHEPAWSDPSGSRVSGFTAGFAESYNTKPQLVVNYTESAWSFAVIADTHIGGGDDYGNVGWLDGNSGADGGNDTPMGYLRKSVGIINDMIQYKYYNIKFVVVLGDISSSAEESEFLKARDILNTLSVDWIPLIGNHDVWPYVGPVPNGSPPNEAPYRSAYPDYNGADYYYHTILADPQYDYLSTKFANWKWPASYICESYPPGQICTLKWNQETEGGNPPRNNYWENFSFDYSGLHFMALDFNDRNPAMDYPPNYFPGVSGEADLFDSDQALGTWYTFKIWLNDYLASQPSGYEDVVLLAHHPMITYRIIWGLYEMGFTSGEQKKMYDDFLSQEPYKSRVWAEFAGHLHNNFVDQGYRDGTLDIVRTQANAEKPTVRIVSVLPNGTKTYNTLLYERVAFWDTDCPVDFVLTDPDGLTISKSLNKIPGATYSEYDRDGDGSLDDRIWIPDLKPGNYTVQVIAEPGAQPTDTYSLTVSPMEQGIGYTPIVIAKDVPISEIPSQPYVFTHKERTATQLTYTGDLVGAYSDSLNLSATLTNGSNPVAGKTIKFMVGNQTASAVTGPNGIAATSIILEQTPGQYCYSEISFDGDQDYLPSYDWTEVEVLIKVEAGTNQTVGEGQVVNFAGSAAPQTGNYTVGWSFGDGGNSTGNLTTTHAYGDNGIYTVTLSVTDYNTGRGNDTLTVTVNNVAPTVEAGPNQNKNQGATVYFSGSFTDPGWLDTHTIQWTFGDGGTASGTLTPTHAYSEDGLYTVTLQVTDDNGGVGTDTLTVRVNFADSFEVNLNNWNDNGITQWLLSTDQKHDGSKSVKATASNQGYLTSDNINLSGATSATLDFWFRKNDIGTTDYTLYFYNGSSYNLITELDSRGADNTWLHYSASINLTTYGKSNFRVRFDATLSGSEQVWLDQLVLTRVP